MPAEATINHWNCGLFLNDSQVNFRRLFLLHATQLDDIDLSNVVVTQQTHSHLGSVVLEFNLGIGLLP
jgi:hypothetical protein